MSAGLPSPSANSAPACYLFITSGCICLGESAREVTVRRIRPGEWESLRAIRLKALESDPLAFGSTLAREAAFDESVWIERAERYATSEWDCMWLAAGEEGIIGMAAIYHSEKWFDVVSVWVDPAFRGKRIGVHMMEELLAWFRSNHGDARLRLYVNPTERPAVELYRRLGFIPTGAVETLSHAPGESIIEMELSQSR